MFLCWIALHCTALYRLAPRRSYFLIKDGHNDYHAIVFFAPNQLIADWVQKIQCLKICVQSEAKTQMGSWTSPLKVSSQGLSGPSCKLSLAPGFTSHRFCLSSRLSAPGSPRMRFAQLNYKCNRMSARTVVYKNQLYNIAGYLYLFRALSVQ